MITQSSNLQIASKCFRICSAGSKLNNCIVLLVFLAGMIFSAGGGAWGQTGAGRVALVLAAEDYTHFAKSPIDAKSARSIAEALERQGFDTAVAVNPNNAVARATMRDFAQKAEGAEAAIVVLTGHGASSGGRTYFLPVNAEITRDTDLLSRGLAVASVSQIAGRAKFGGVFFLMTVPDVPSTLQSVGARPSMTGEPEKNVVVVFSSSDKVPVSRVDRVSEQAVRDFVDAAREKPLLLTALVDAATAGGVGKVFGAVPNLDLSSPPPPPATTASTPGAQEAEARRLAEARVREAEERAREAEARARQAEERARLAAARAAEDAKGKSEAQAPLQPSALAPPNAPAGDDVASLQIVEALLGRAQRRQVQSRLRELGFYTGSIDAVFGDLTRQAIKDYQRSVNATMTGYLTPQQIQELARN